MDLKKTGALMKELRTAKGMTQEQLADAVHVSRAAVSKWERGLSFPDVELLEPLADVFGVSVSDLLSGEVKDKADEEPLKNLIGLQKEKNEKRRKRIRITLAVIGILLFINFAKAAAFTPKKAALKVYGGEESTEVNDDTSSFDFYYDFGHTGYVAVTIPEQGGGIVYPVKKSFWHYLPFDAGNYFLGNFKDSGELRVTIDYEGNTCTAGVEFGGTAGDDGSSRISTGIAPTSKFHIASVDQNEGQIVFENEEGKQFTLQFSCHSGETTE